MKCSENITLVNPTIQHFHLFTPPDQHIDQNNFISLDLQNLSNYQQVCLIVQTIILIIKKK